MCVLSFNFNLFGCSFALGDISVFSHMYLKNCLSNSCFQQSAKFEMPAVIVLLYSFVTNFHVEAPTSFRVGLLEVL